MALEKNPLHKAALAGTHISLAGVREARSPLMPKIMFTESAVRGNDPVFVFGTRLRQQSFTAADFALNKLNTPTPIGNFSSRFSGQWSLFDGLQSWYGVTRAKYMQQASEQQLDRTDQELVYQAVQAYYGVLLAQKQLAVAEDTLKTAQAIEDAKPCAGGKRHGGGLRSAERAGGYGLAEAGTDPGAKRVGPGALAIGAGAGHAVGHDLSSRRKVWLSTASRPSRRRSGDSRRWHKRPDLKQVESERSAQAKSISMAKGAFAPRLNVYGSWETDSPSPGWNGGNNWIAGAELQFDHLRRRQQARTPGGGKSRCRKRRRPCATPFAIRFGCKSARLITTTTRPGSRWKWRAAPSQQAEESLRINQNRYDGGLTTVSDLLRVEEAAHRAQTDYWQAVYRMQTSYAGVELAAGTLTPSSPAVTQ